MKLLVQPGDGIAPLLKGINGARKSIDIVIFRFDRREIEKALANAVSRGVQVHALIAYTNRGGEKNLRKLELQLLAAGVTVARTADDLARYHGKFMIIDRRELYLLAFNFTYIDMERSRSFGVVTTNSKLVQQAAKLFDADTERRPYTPSFANFVVSPENARKQLADFIKAAKRELLIYDLKVSDREMIRLLEDRSKAGVDIKMIGRLARESSKLETRRLGQMRLHARAMVRDGRDVFIGSQSLRDLELDARREVGVIFRDQKIASRLIKIFHSDWDSKDQAADQRAREEVSPAAKVAKKVARAVAKDLPPLAPVVEATVREVAGEDSDVQLDAEDVEETVKEAVKEAVKQVVRDVVAGAAER